MKKNKLLCALVCLLVLLLVSPVLAAGEHEMTISAPQTASPGDTITVTVSLSEVLDCTAVGLGVKYDEAVFEMVEGSFQILASNVKQSSFRYVANAKGYVANIQMDGKKTVSGALFQFSLKVKDSAALGQNCTISGTASLRVNNAAAGCTLKDTSVALSCKHTFGSWMPGEDGKHTHSCTACGFSESAPHAYDGGVVTQDSTCAAEGIKTYTCGDCGHSYTEAIAKKSHTYDGGKVTKDPGCTETGVTTFTCTGCGDSYTENIPETGHHYDDGVVTQDSTCAAEGVKTFTCAGCGDSYTESIGLKPHTYDKGVITTQPDCTGEGVKTFTCTGCGHTYTESVDKEAHKYDDGTVTRQPTCAQEGERTYKCTQCGVEKTEPIEKTTDHKFGGWKDVDDSKHKHTCTVCGKEETASHSYDGGKVTKAPTCAEEGIKTFTCADCGGTRTEAVDKTTDHKFGSWTDVDDSKHKHTCTVCGKEETASHNYDGGKVTQDPTCAVEGIKTFTCTDCGGTKTEAVDKTTDHKYGDWGDVDDDTHKHICQVCGGEETASHTYNSGTQTTAPTCAAEGVRTYTCTQCQGTREEAIAKLTVHTYDHACDTECNVCGLKRSITHQYGEKHTGDDSGHWYECGICGHKKDQQAHTPGKEATEWDPQTCTVCGYVLQPALGHTHRYEEKLTSDGKGHWYACAGCEEIKDYAEHSFDNSCDTTCDLCGYKRNIEHNYNVRWSFDENGHWHECSICGDMLEMLKHTPGPEATEQADQICLDCGYVIQPAKEHVHVPVGDWLSDENQHWYQCACGEIINTQDHTWDGGTRDEEAGKVTYQCTECGYARVEDIPVEPTEPSDPTDPTVGTVPQDKDDPKDPPKPLDTTIWIVAIVVFGLLLCGVIYVIVGILVSRRKVGKYSSK